MPSEHTIDIFLPALIGISIAVGLWVLWTLEIARERPLYTAAIFSSSSTVIIISRGKDWFQHGWYGDGFIAVWLLFIALLIVRYLKGRTIPKDDPE